MLRAEQVGFCLYTKCRFFNLINHYDFVQLGRKLVQPVICCPQFCSCF